MAPRRSRSAARLEKGSAPAAAPGPALAAGALADGAPRARATHSAWAWVEELPAARAEHSRRPAAPAPVRCTSRTATCRPRRDRPGGRADSALARAAGRPDPPPAPLLRRQRRPAGVAPD